MQLELSKKWKLVIFASLVLVLVLVAFNIGFIWGRIHEGFLQSFPEDRLEDRESSVTIDRGKMRIEDAYFTNSLEWEVGQYRYERNFSSGEHVLENMTYRKDNRTLLIVKYRVTGSFSEGEVFRDIDALKLNSFYSTENRRPGWNFYRLYLDEELPPETGEKKTLRFREGGELKNITLHQTGGEKNLFVTNLTGYYVEPIGGTGLDRLMLQVEDKYIKLGEMNDKKIRRDYLVLYARQRLREGFECGNALPLICS